MALALGYLFDPMHSRGWIHEHTKEQRDHDWFNRFFSDLNAMHEAEKTLDANHEQMYYDRLCSIAALDAYRATARQRAEAFLATTQGQGSGVCAQSTATDNGRERNEGHPGDPSEYGDSN